MAKIKEKTKTSIKVKFVLLAATAKLPVYKHDNDADCDLHAAESATIKPGERRAITTAVAWLPPKAPVGKKYVLIVKSRSGMAFNDNGEASNAGVVDEGYTGPIKVMIQNFGSKPIKIKLGDRFAQGIIQELPLVEIEKGTIAELNKKSGRGAKGFGSTGK